MCARAHFWGRQLATAHGKAAALQDWRRDRDRVNHRAARASVFCALCGVCGASCAIVQHEFILRGMSPHADEVRGRAQCAGRARRGMVS